MEQTHNTLIEEQVAALLGRSLTDTETINFDLYLDIAKLRLENLVCFDFTAKAELDPLPSDLSLVWARIFGILATENQGGEVADRNVESKRIEDFAVTFKDGERSSVFAEIVRLNQPTISKYSRCSSPIRHGKTIYDWDE